MKKREKSKDSFTKERRKRLLKAEKDLLNVQKIKEEIAPYIKSQKFKEYSTAGKWQETSSLFHKNRLKEYHNG